MKKLILSVSILYSVNTFSQDRIEYANFIQTDTAIKWAAVYSSYVNLTPVNPNYNIGNYFINSLKKEQRLHYVTNDVDFTVIPTPYTYKEMLANLSFEKYDPQKINIGFGFNDEHDGSDQVLYNEQNTCDTCLNNKLSIIKVKQLLYYRNSQFKIRNILLNPIVYKKAIGAGIDSTIFSETINVAFDAVTSDKNDIPASAVFIGRGSNKIDLRINQTSENKILTIKNPGLASQLYKDIMCRKITAYSTDLHILPNKNSILAPNKIETYHNPPEIVDIYDYKVDGGHASKMVIREVYYDSFYIFKLVQDFYFDFATEKMYSKLVTLIPQKSVYTSTGVYLGLADHWGVIFPDEKKKKAVIRTK